jgi:hypothetical protein
MIVRVCSSAEHVPDTRPTVSLVMLKELAADKELDCEPDSYDMPEYVLYIVPEDKLKAAPEYDIEVDTVDPPASPLQPTSSWMEYFMYVVLSEAWSYCSMHSPSE